MAFDFEADRRLADLHGYEPAGSALPMLLRCGANQRGPDPNFWELNQCQSHESAPMPSTETFPVADSGARPDVRQLNEPDAIWGD